MKRRLLLSYLGLALLILVILELPMATLAQRFEQQLATNQAQKDVSGVVALTTDDIEASNAAALHRILSGYRARTGDEITVLDPTGAVTAQSSDDPDDDAREWTAVAQRALTGQPAASFLTDEGKPYAVAATPVSDEGRTVAVVMLGQSAGFTESRIHQIWLALVLFAVAAMAVAAVTGLVLARSFALPLGRLESAVKRLGAGHLASRAKESAGPPEVRELARQFNHMAAQLDDLIDAQRQFVADASHQLRSPLTALRLRLENLEAGASGDLAESLAVFGNEVQRLSRLVDGLLALSRAEEPSRTQDVAVREVIAQRVEAWDALAAEKGVQIVDGSNGAGPVTCRLHPGDLDQILDNLLANAVEVSPPSSRIVVSLKGPPSRQVEVHVTDEGPGMSDRERSRAFDRFWQGSAQPTGHSGLGLAIVKQLSARNGLRVELRPVDPHGLDAVLTAADDRGPGAVW